jgi:hypothetical protein
MAGQAQTRSFSLLPALGAVLALVLALSGGWAGTAPGAHAASDPAGTPVGHFDNAVAVPGGIHLWGWAIDPDTTTPIYVWVTLDGTARHLYANAPRPDVAAAYPSSGPNHGFVGTLTAPAGTHTVCATASNIGPGTHQPLGCRTITVRAGSPIGNFENARAVNGGIEVKGWAIDPDTTTSIYMWVTLDGVGRHLYANQARPDVAAAYPAYGPNHGFTGTLIATTGTHTLCVTASNVGPGAHTPYGCRSVTLTPAGSPVGNYEEAHGVVGGIEIKGWAIDTDTTDPIYVWVTIDGVGRHLYANQTRPDVAAAYPTYGPNHGFTGTLIALAGTHTVCVTASNVGPGAHRSLGCRTATAQGDATISGGLCFPSEGIPPMNGFFRDTSTGQTWTLPIMTNPRSYQVGLPAGTYLVFAYTVDGIFGGAYTKAVPCGQGLECTDHSLLPVTVQHGQAVGGIDLCDWDVPDSLLPPNPLG